MSKDTPEFAAMKGLVAPVEISRLLLLGFVAAGALASITTSGQLSAFAGGFAVGAGAAFVVSRLRRPAEPGSAGESGEVP
ncbi:MAG TPA: hypothetical protein VJ776_10825 [Thermoanaerobaculia bacterium]|nr:hypothetical protein [Thermoanaerobaculia bacterium]